MWRKTISPKCQKAEPIEWYPKDETWQTTHINQIKQGFRLLIALNITITFSLLFLLQKFISLKYRLFFVVLSPLSYALYAWIFNKTAVWQPMEDMPVTKNWKEKHFSMLPAFFHEMIIFLCVENILDYKVNIIAGQVKMTVLMIVLFAALLIVTGIRTQVRINRGLTVFYSAFFFMLVVWCTGPGTILVSAKQMIRSHYSAEIINTFYHSGKHRNYEAAVILSDGTHEVIAISKYDYDGIQVGKEKVICEYESLFGVKFITVHDPVR